MAGINISYEENIGGSAPALIGQGFGAAQELGHNGDISRNASLPRTTKRRTTTNLKTKNNQNCQIFNFMDV